MQIKYFQQKSSLKCCKMGHKYAAFPHKHTLFHLDLKSLISLFLQENVNLPKKIDKIFIHFFFVFTTVFRQQHFPEKMETLQTLE